MAEDFDPITGLDGEDNMGGYKSRIAFIPAGAVSATPKLADAIVADADYVEAVGAFIFKDAVNGKPIGIECTDATVKYSAPSQGELEGQSYAPAGEFFRAGSKESYAAFARRINNRPGYLIFEDVSGKQIMVGQPGMLCNIKTEYDGGMKRADRRGFKFTYAADSVAPVIYLKTKIDIDALFEA